MEKAISKTLIYADLFDYPLKINEIHKWLIGEKATPRQIEKALKNLSEKRKTKSKKGYYFLPKREMLVDKRLRRQKQSERYFRKVKILSQILKIIPWIKLVGISGGLAMGNAGKYDDIDLFIIIGKNRLWISRLLVLGLLSAVGQRRKRKDYGRKIAGKLCTNILLEEDKLEQTNKDIFTAHEVSQMKVLWQRDGVYSKYLSDNSWVFKFLPNWIGNSFDVSLRGIYQNGTSRGPLRRVEDEASNLHIPWKIENFAKWLQLKIMDKPKGMERIENGALYFHPEDCRLKILSEFKKRVSKLNIGTP